FASLGDQSRHADVRGGGAPRPPARDRRRARHWTRRTAVRAGAQQGGPAPARSLDGAARRVCARGGDGGAGRELRLPRRRRDCAAPGGRGEGCAPPPRPRVLGRGRGGAPPGRGLRRRPHAIAGCLVGTHDADADAVLAVADAAPAALPEAARACQLEATRRTREALLGRVRLLAPCHRHPPRALAAGSDCAEYPPLAARLARLGSRAAARIAAAAGARRSAEPTSASRATRRRTGARSRGASSAWPARPPTAGSRASAPTRASAAIRARRSSVASVGSSPA